MLTNDKNIPLAIAVWLATDDYSKREGSISVTTLMKPVRQIVLSARAAQVGRDMDVSVFTASRMGTAIHDSIEKAWLNPKLPNVLKALDTKTMRLQRYVSILLRMQIQLATLTFTLRTKCTKSSWDTRSKGSMT